MLRSSPVLCQLVRRTVSPLCASAAAGAGGSGASGGGGGYKYFEDFFPQHPPGPQFEYYEDQVRSATFKSLEVKPQMSETEKLNYLHDWKREKDGFVPPPQYGWHEDWGPEPGEEGHEEWYKKNRMYMSFDEKARMDIRHGVPVEKNVLRHQEMPFHQHMKAAYHNLQEMEPKPMFDTRKRGYDTTYSHEAQRDTMGVARDDFMQQWLSKPGVTPETMAKTIGDYNGTAKHQNVKSVDRRPEWELAPKPENMRD